MKRKMILFVVLLVGITTVTGCVDKKEQIGTSESISTDSESGKGEKISATVKILDDSKSEDKKITVSKENNLLEIMKENFDIKVEKRQIISINGVKQDEKAQRYWIVTVNGEELNVALDQIRLNQGDVVEFRLEN